MKKPTFSKLLFFVFFLFENLFQKKLFFYTCFMKEERKSLKNRFFQKHTFCTPS